MPPPETSFEMIGKRTHHGIEKCIDYQRDGDGACRKRCWQSKNLAVIEEEKGAESESFEAVRKRTYTLKDLGLSADFSNTRALATIANRLIAHPATFHFDSAAGPEHRERPS